MAAILLFITRALSLFLLTHLPLTIAQETSPDNPSLQSIYPSYISPFTSPPKH